MASEITGSNQTREVQDAVANARDGIRQAYDRGAEKAAQLKDAAMERASQWKDVAIDKGRSALTVIENTIEERPFTVIGGVFLGGLVLGFLLRRK